LPVVTHTLETIVHQNHYSISTPLSTNTMAQENTFSRVWLIEKPMAGERKSSEFQMRRCNKVTHEVRDKVTCNRWAYTQTLIVHKLWATC
jgi:hypothetical protein